MTARIGYDLGMKRVTISIPDEIAEKATRAVQQNRAESVSAYFVALAEREPDWALAEEAVRELLGSNDEISSKDSDWASEVLGVEPDVSDAA